MKHFKKYFLTVLISSFSLSAFSMEMDVQTYLNLNLIDAAKNDDLDRVEECLKKGADVDCFDKCGATPLHCASFYRCYKVIELLLEKGANIDARCKNGETPVHWACRYDRPEVLQCLLDGGASANVVNKKGHTPFLIAYKDKNAEIKKILKSKGYEFLWMEKIGQSSGLDKALMDKFGGVSSPTEVEISSFSAGYTEKVPLDDEEQYIYIKSLDKCFTRQEMEDYCNK